MFDMSDEEIVALVKAGQVEPFGFLVERYEDKMKRYAKRFLFNYDESEDLVQEVFLKAYIHIQSFDTNKSFSAWLYRIAHNQFINAIKKKGKEPLSFFDFDILLPYHLSQENPETAMSKRETKQAINQCLNKLIPKYREPLILYYFEELSYKKIAEVLRVPISTVGVRIKRAKKQLSFFYQKLNHHL